MSIPKNEETSARTSARAFPWRCADCGKKEIRPAIVNYDAPLKYEGDLLSIKIPDLELSCCANCGNRPITDAAESAIIQAARKTLNLLTPDQIRTNLEELGINQKDFSWKLGIAPETLSHWLNDSMLHA